MTSPENTCNQPPMAAPVTHEEAAHSEGWRDAVLARFKKFIPGIAIKSKLSSIDSIDDTAGRVASNSNIPNNETVLYRDPTEMLERGSTGILDSAAELPNNTITPRDFEGDDLPTIQITPLTESQKENTPAENHPTQEDAPDEHGDEENTIVIPIENPSFRTPINNSGYSESNLAELKLKEKSGDVFYEAFGIQNPQNNRQSPSQKSAQNYLENKLTQFYSTQKIIKDIALNWQESSESKPTDLNGEDIQTIKDVLQSSEDRQRDLFNPRHQLWGGEKFISKIRKGKLSEKDVSYIYDIIFSLQSQYTQLEVSRKDKVKESYQARSILEKIENYKILLASHAGVPYFNENESKKLEEILERSKNTPRQSSATIRPDTAPVESANIDEQHNTQPPQAIASAESNRQEDILYQHPEYTDTEWLNSLLSYVQHQISNTASSAPLSPRELAELKDTTLYEAIDAVLEKDPSTEQNRAALRGRLHSIIRPNIR